MIDLDDVRRSVWASYSQRVLARCRSMLEAFGGAIPGLPPEVIEEMLCWIYREEGFPVLLADELAARIRSLIGSKAAGLRLLVSKNFPVSPRLLPREFVRPKTTNRQAASRLLRWLALPLSRVCMRLNLLAARLRGERHDAEIEHWPDEVYALYPGWSTHTRHVWTYLGQDDPSGAPRDRIVFALGNALRHPRPEVPAEATGGGVRFIRPLHRSDLASCYAALKQSWPVLSRLFAAALADVQVDRRTEARWLLRAAYFLLNAKMIDAYVERLGPMSGGSAVFGLVASPADTALDLALQKQGRTTIHWLHGNVAYGLQYRGHSSVCLCRSPVEAEVRATFGAYGTCLSAASSGEAAPGYAPRDEKSGLLLLTNLIHREAPCPMPRGAEAEAHLHTLLKITADVAEARREPLCWRPHPRERANRKPFSKAADAVRQRANTLDEAPHLSAQLTAHRYVVCTFSTTIADAVEAGVVPAVYAGAAYENVGYWKHLPEALKFRTADGLRQILDRLDDAAFARTMYDRLAALFNTNAQQLPTPGAFAHLASGSVAPAPARLFRAGRSNRMEATEV